MEQFVNRASRTFIAGAVLLCGAVLPAATQSYHVARSFRLAGDGGWDYLALDTVGHRLFIAHQDRIMVVDPDSGRVLGEIPCLSRAHGVAFAYEAGHGFATSGADSTVTMFDLKSLRVLGHTMVPPDDDAVLYDPATKRIFTFNGDAHSATAIDAVSGKRLGDIELGAGPEFGVSAGDGKLFVNLEDKNAVAELDAAAMRVKRQWSLAPCESPTGLAIDRVHHELVAATAEQQMVDPIDGQPCGRLAGRERPLAFHSHRSRVELRHRILVLQIHEQFPVSRRNAELRTRPELDIAEPFSRDGIDRGGGMRVAVERENALGRRVVQHGIVVRGHHRVAEHSWRLEIEHRDGAVRPRRGEAVTRFIREGHAVGPIQTRDFPEHFSAVGVDHDDAVLVRDEQPMAHGVEGEVVPPAVAAERVAAGDVVGLGREGEHGTAQQEHAAGEYPRQSAHDRSVSKCDDTASTDSAIVSRRRARERAGGRA